MADLSALFRRAFPGALKVHQIKNDLLLAIDQPIELGVCAFLGPFMIQIKCSGGPALFEILTLDKGQWLVALRRATATPEEALDWGRAWLLGQTSLFYRLGREGQIPVPDPEIDACQGVPDWFDRISCWHLVQLLRQGFPGAEVKERAPTPERRVAVAKIGLLAAVLMIEAQEGADQFRACLRVLGHHDNRSVSMGLTDQAHPHMMQASYTDPGRAVEWITEARGYLGEITQQTFRFCGLV